MEKCSLTRLVRESVCVRNEMNVAEMKLKV